MANTGSIGNEFDSSGIYAQYFGNLKSGVVYQDKLGAYKNLGLKITPEDSFNNFNENSPMIKNARAFKAQGVTSGGGGTAGYAMVPVFVDPRIVDRTRKQTPLVSIMPRVSNNGMYADYNVITAKGGAFTAAEDSALAETNTTYDRGSTAIKFLYSIGRVTGPSIAAQPSYVMDSIQGSDVAPGTANYGTQSAPNALQQEVLVKTREIKELEEGLLIRGNATTSVYAGEDGTEFNGIVEIMSTTNTVDKNTTYLTLGDIELAARYAYDDGGFPSIAICDSATYLQVLELVNDKLGYLKSVETTEYGFTGIKYHTIAGPLTIIPSRFMSTTTAERAMYLLDMSSWETRVLQDLTYEELAKVNDSRKFMLKSYETLICRAAAFNASITEIK